MPFDPPCEWTSALLDLVTAFDPGFGAALVPLGQDEIDRFASGFSAPLPRDYTDLLRTMGNDDGGLFGAYGLTVAFSAVHGKGRARIGLEQDLDVAADSYTNDRYGYRLPETLGGREIVALYGENIGEVFCPSLPAMAFGAAALYEMRATGRHLSSQRPTGRKPKGHERWRSSIAGALAMRGYERQWYSGGHAWYLRAGPKLVALVGSAPDRQIVCAGAASADAYASARADVNDLVDGVVWHEPVTSTLPQRRAQKGSR